MLAAKTQGDDVIAFMRLIRNNADVRPEKPIVIVLDNHKAHWGEKTASVMRELNLQPLFMPAYSPELNSIETLWGTVKTLIKNFLANNEGIHRITGETFLAAVQQILIFDRENAVSFMACNRKALKEQLDKMQPDSMVQLQE